MTDPLPVGFAGLSHLGIIYSAAAAARGFSVVAYDGRASLTGELAEGRFPIAEPGLRKCFEENRQRLGYSSDAGKLAACRLIFVTLDVATDDRNISDLGPLEQLIDRVSAVAGPDTTLAVMSQVPPGYCRALAGRLRRTLRLFYQVETLVFGNAVERTIRPERYMIGSERADDPLPADYERYLKAFECPVLPMRFESAELCKIAINCFLVSTVATANTLAGVCERIGADWSEIIPALRLDRRIGPHAYLHPGLGMSGGNLERDMATIQRLGAEHGCETGIVDAWQRNSRHRRDWVLRLLHRRGLLDESSRLAVWGLAYKADTHSIKNSPSVELLRTLAPRVVSAYDAAASLAQEEFPHVRLCPTALEAANGADALLVMTPWKEFSMAPLAALCDVMRKRLVIDPYAALKAEECGRLGFEYHRLGA